MDPTALDTNGHELAVANDSAQDCTVENSIGQAAPQQSFADRFPGVTNPSDGLRLLQHFGYKDGPDLILCFQMLYPELITARDALAQQLEIIRQFTGCRHQVCQDDQFWFTPFFFQCAEFRYGSGEWRGYIARRTEDTSDAWRGLSVEAERASAAVRTASAEFSSQLAKVMEPLILREQIEQHLVKLEASLGSLQRWLEDRAAVAERREAGEAQRATSSAASSTSGGHLLTPMPGVYRVGSASSGILSLSAHNRATRQPHSSQRQGTHYGQAFPESASPGIASRIKALTTSLTRPFTHIWQRFRREPLTARLGHPRTVWTLILLVSLIAAASTALAAWKSGPNTALPELDSNFYSTLSQNLLSAAGLYCIIIPLLQKVKLNARNPGLFYGFLIASAVGTFVSTVVYMVHTRTIMVLAYVAALTQLLATLQLIVAQGSRVKGLQVSVDNLEGEVTRLRAERR